jgi:hypothetical protein
MTHIVTVSPHAVAIAGLGKRWTATCHTRNCLWTVRYASKADRDQAVAQHRGEDA